MRKEYVMEAVFTEDAYKALMNGEAVDNNGLRSSKGNYWSEQPSFRLKNKYQEEIKEAEVEFAILAGRYVIFNIILPNCKRFADENIYPFLAEKFDEWKERKKQKVTKKEQEIIVKNKKNVDEDKIVDFTNRRRSA